PPRAQKPPPPPPPPRLPAAKAPRRGGPGASQHIWEATLGPGTMVFAIHPGATPKQMLGRLPRVGQHKNLLFVVHDIPTEPYPGPKVIVPPDVGEFRPSPAPSEETFAPHTVAVFRRAAFDEVAQDKNWTFGRKGKGYVALWSRQPTPWWPGATTTSGSAPWAGRRSTARSTSGARASPPPRSWPPTPA